MNIKVLYNSRGGNTKKVAEAIANTARTVCESISESTSFGQADLLFIGDGNYCGKFDKKTMEFIKTLNPSKVRYAVVFGTYGGNTKSITHAEELLRNQGITLIGKNFGCKGGWLLMNRNHPNVEDITAVKKFTNDVIEEINNAIHKINK